MSVNRVQAHIDKVQALIDAKDDPDTLAKLEASMAIDFGEHFVFQEEKSRAHVQGLLSVDEAQIIYVALGEVGSEANGGWAAGTTLATKVTVTQIIQELLTARLR